jgi:hypothetical protein
LFRNVGSTRLWKISAENSAAGRGSFWRRAGDLLICAAYGFSLGGVAETQGLLRDSFFLFCFYCPLISLGSCNFLPPWAKITQVYAVAASPNTNYV